VGLATSLYGASKGVAKPYKPQALHQDENAYNYGGSAEGTSAWRDELAKRDAGALGGADKDAQMAAMARNQQQGLLGQYQQMAAGKGPSLAQEQAKRMLGQAQAAQVANAANVRGGAGNQLVAARGAADLGGQLQAQANQQASELRAKEQLAAMDAQKGLLGDIRSGDFTARGMGEQRAAGALGARMGLEDRALGSSIQRDQDARAGEQWLEEARMGAGKSLSEQQQKDKDRWMQFGGDMMSGGGQVAGAGATKKLWAAGPPTSRTRRGEATRCTTMRGAPCPSPPPRMLRRW
jgi:hypothetical protein